MNFEKWESLDRHYYYKNITKCLIVLLLLFIYLSILFILGIKNEIKPSTPWATILNLSCVIYKDQHRQTFFYHFLIDIFYRNIYREAKRS